MESASPVSTALRTGLAATLRHPNYAKLLTGQVIAAFGDGINRTALLSIVLYLYGPSHAAKCGADIMFWATLPPVVLGPFVMALIDRWDRQKTMMVSDGARAILAASLPVLIVYVGHHYAIYAVVFLMGAFGALFAPSRLAILPNLIPAGLLMSANAMSSQAGTAAHLLGLPVGGWIAEQTTYEVCFALNAATYLCSVAFIWRLRPEPRHMDAPERRHATPLEDFRAGLGYTRRSPPVLLYVFFAALTQCLMGMFFVCFLDYTAQVVGKGATRSVLPIIMQFGALAGGMITGALWLGRYSKIGERFLWPMIMLACAGIGIFLLSFVQTSWAAGLLFLGIGFCAVMVLAPVDTYLQKHVPDEFRGRVFVVRGVLGGIGFLVFLQFSKGIIHQMGILGALELLGAACCLVGMITGVMGRDADGKPPSGRVSR